MKKIFSILTILVLLGSLGFVVALPSTGIDIVGGGNPIYTESPFAPLVFLNHDSRVLFDDPYGPFQNGDISGRNDNYAFMGEQIQWQVLVFDKNGIEKISDVGAYLSPQTNGPDGEFSLEANCDLASQQNDGIRLDQLGFYNVRVPGEEEDKVYFDEDTMEIYNCIYTVEPGTEESGTYGQYWFNVEAIDFSGLTGSTSEAESWFFNPILDISVSGHVDFGELGPGERGSSTISVSNNADAGSGMSVIFGISGTDFYPSASSGAMCPTTNQLELQPWFTYSAVQGFHQVSNKQIPYGVHVTDADPLFSSGDGVVPNYSNLISTSPGAEVSMTLNLELPVPCNGQFDSGRIILWAVPV